MVVAIATVDVAVVAVVDILSHLLGVVDVVARTANDCDRIQLDLDYLLDLWLSVDLSVCSFSVVLQFV